ncbi:hypothetical protein GCM10027610_027700 [Dactylosporangium cerinum]
MTAGVVAQHRLEHVLRDREAFARAHRRAAGRRHVLPQRLAGQVSAPLRPRRDRQLHGPQVEAVAAHLAPGIDVDAGVAIYLTLVLPEVYRTLVIERGWTADRYEQWLAGALITQLLRPPA